MDSKVPCVCSPFADHHAGDVGAEADEGGVAERHHAAVAEHQVEAGRRDRVDQDAPRHADVEGCAECVQGPRQRERGEDRERQRGAAPG